MIQLEGIIPPGELKKLLAEHLPYVTWLAGNTTAGRAASSVKSCSIADPGNGAATRIRHTIGHAVTRCAALCSYAWIDRVISMMLVRYDVGDSYGVHTDAARMRERSNVDVHRRSDISFTVFLNHDYEGGELAIETGLGEARVRMKAGGIVAYPSTTLHRVTPVTHGSRIVVVGWIRSLIRSAEQRELLSDIEMARAKLFEACGKCDEFDALTKASSNLQRMWMDD